RIVEPKAVQRSLARGGTTVELPVIMYSTRGRESDQTVLRVENPVQHRCLTQVVVRNNTRQQYVGLIGVNPMEVQTTFQIIRGRLVVVVMESEQRRPCLQNGRVSG